MSDEPVTRVVLLFKGRKITETTKEIQDAFGTTHGGSHVHILGLVRLDMVDDNEIRRVRKRY